ncbi:hypothetical protein G7Y89_g13119 [Cudoniella acicularis]|uniref:Uncharacterized protein n=1 Tax=Cudoniella acicularis TaxID=354080 RepID=A0A8H4VYJ4_9HELO|nr:hypothetical protein G7Y89_g13119 [Cudoniella acicularis]
MSSLSALGITVNPNGTYTIPLQGGEGLFIPTDGLTGENRNNNTAYGNITIYENSNVLCTLSLCDLSLAHFDYIPSIGGNSLYAAIFGIFILMNIFQGIRYKTWGYMVAMCIGLAGEVVGYIARILLWQNPFDPTGNNFLIYLVCLTISPALLAAGIYLCLGRIVVVYGEHLSRFRPRTYTIIFCLSVQVASLVLFAAFCIEFAYRIWRNPTSWSRTHAHLYESKLFKYFLLGLCIATIAIFIRSCFRVAELSGGFDGPLANNQISFMILEGAMIVIATSCMTLLHPGLAFKGSWEGANFTFRVKGAVLDEQIEMGGDTEDSLEAAKGRNGRSSLVGESA